MNIVKRWKFGITKCDCVNRKCGLTVEQTEENCGWVRYTDYSSLYDEFQKMKSQVQWMTMKEAQNYDKNRNIVEFMVNCVSSGDFKVYKDGSVKFGSAIKKSKKK